jgi:hypothetical protein
MLDINKFSRKVLYKTKESGFDQMDMHLGIRRKEI